MLARVTGKLIEKQPTTLTLSTVQLESGFAFEVTVPDRNTYRELELSTFLTLYTFLQIRAEQGDVHLFGFLSEFEKQVFLKLISVDHVGPKLAMQILTSIEPAELVQAIQTENRERLTKISGVGKKTVERILLELTPKIHALLTTGINVPIEENSKATTTNSGLSIRQQLIDALASLGYRPAEIESFVNDSIKKSSEAGGPANLRDQIAYCLRKIGQAKMQGQIHSNNP